MEKSQRQQQEVFDLSIFIFRRDFRLMDNNGLKAACEQSKRVLPIFHFNPDQIDPCRNAFFNHASVQVMCESLEDLDNELRKFGSRLVYLMGDLEKCISSLLEEVKPDAVFVNEDYSPFSRKRDALINDICQQHNVKFFSYHDMMLIEKNQVLKPNGSFFTQFTPYFLKASKKPVAKPDYTVFKNFTKENFDISTEFKGNIHDFYIPNSNIAQHGGRKNGLQVLESITGFKDYAKVRVYPVQDTTKISAHTKYGTVSIREVYWAIADGFGKKHDLLRQIFWRDFYYNIMYHFPDTVYDSYVAQFRKITWPHQEEWFQAWKEGKTGYPFVDAGMRQLNATSYFPNVMRLTVANFLVKILLIDWRKGQLYLANNMLDYDLAQNNGGWQWAASTGAFKQPFDVIFNPWVQSAQYDKDCAYIKKWCPELKDVPAKHIHDWEHHYQEYPNIDYPTPIVFFDERKKEVLEWYKNYVVSGAAKPHGIDINSAEIYEGMFDDEEEEMEEHDLEDI